MSWRERYRIASAVLLASTGLLLLLDFWTRTASEPSILFLCLASIFFSLYYGTLPWHVLPRTVRSLPAASCLLLIIFTLFWTNPSQSQNIELGITLGVMFIAIYMGFIYTPGYSSIAMVLTFIALYGSYQLTLDTIPMYLLVVCPFAALLGEILSFTKIQIQEHDQKSKKRRELVHAVEEVLKQFHRPKTMQEAAQKIAEAAQKIFEAEHSTVVLRDPQGNILSISQGIEKQEEEPDHQTSGLVIEAIGGTTPTFVPYQTETLLVSPIPSGETSAGAVLAYPISSQDQEFFLTIASLFTTQIGIAIEHLFVINALEKENTRDELTGIGNRKHANALLDSLEEGDAIILLDLDSFKQVNDTLGHPAGDQVLLDLGSHLRVCLRDSDTSARLGGDEFLVVAKKAYADPKAVAQRIVQGWSIEERLTTISAGVALHKSNLPPQTTYDRADKALYKAKSAGKNQACMWDTEVGEKVTG